MSRKKTEEATAGYPTAEVTCWDASMVSTVQ